MMEYQEFIVKLPVVLDLQQTLTGEESLEEIADWDSIKLLSFIAYADREFGRQPQADELKRCRSIKDLYEMLIKR